MQITKDILSHCHTVENDTHADKYHWRIFEKRAWTDQIANLNENSLKMFSGLKKAGLQDTKELIWIEASRKTLE